MTASPPTPRESRLVRQGIAIGLVASLVAFLFGPREGLSVLAGAGISVANLRVLKSIAEGATGVVGSRGALIAAALTGLRYLLLGALLFVIIAVWKASVLGVILGLGAPLGAVALELIGESRDISRTRRESNPAPGAPGTDADHSDPAED